VETEGTGKQSGDLKDGPIQNGGQSTQTGESQNIKQLRSNSLKRNTISTSDVEGWLCELCKINHTKMYDKLMECDYCSKHFCIQCLDMPSKLYNQMVGRLDIKWFCPLCNEKVEKNLKADREIEEKCKLFMQTFEDRIKTLEQKAESFVTAEQVQEIIAKENKTTKEVTNVINSEGDISEAVIKEMAEREKRKNNAIMFKVPEPKTNIKVDKMNADIQLVKDIGSAVKIEINDEDIVKITRLGKKKSNFDTVDIVQERPLLVTFANENVKKNLFANASKMQFVTGSLAAVSLDHDMTPKEREETKKLMLEAKRREEESEGKFIYRVRGPQGAGT